ncbi:MAG: N-6 DNA methylase [Proteobacteria bacterium]|nr:N-6 DNA methylase [Pseudomonadota bacterium]
MSKAKLDHTPGSSPITGESDLAAAAHALGAVSVAGISSEELRMGNRLPVSSSIVNALRQQILAGRDPLGAIFCQLRSPAARRPRGAVYTPPAIVRAMLGWAAGSVRQPDRVIDPGSGSGRFIVSAGRRFATARLVAVELDPLAALLTRAHLAVHGMARRAEVIVADYCSVPSLADFEGTTLFVGNPPYVRHHQIARKAKKWLTDTAARHGLKASGLAGLHVHFFLATVEYAKKGDIGAFITAAEWLDVNYGGLVRKLFLDQLGGRALHIIEPRAHPFPDAATTGAVTCFQVGSRARTIRMRRVADLQRLDSLKPGREVERELLESAARWSPIVHGGRSTPRGYVELGELCRVHRGQVTGANKFWIAGPHAEGLPASVLYRTVTRAKEIYSAGRYLDNKSHLRHVIDLPVDLSQFSGKDKRAIDTFLDKGRKKKIHEGYIARHRKAWWSVGLYQPAPILATYMARRPPGFVRNVSKARHINIAHGIYPRDPMSDRLLDRLAEYLATEISTSQGRTYAGGLTKFEPREMERVLVPSPELLRVA